MFETLADQPADALLSLIKAFKNDPRPHKIDLGVGVYRDTSGRTPVMRAVKAAERTLCETQDSKSYLGPEGDLEFVELLKPHVFGAGHGHGARLTGIQTPGGSGALRLGADLVRSASKSARIFLGTPTWPNHAPILSAAQLPIERYAYIDLATQKIDFEAVLATLGGARAGDVALLHGCCHNPAGLDFSLDQWRQIARVVAERKIVPFIDLAYQGLGDGMEEDAAPMRLILEQVEEALIAYSCDKNFGLYRDRVGALYVLGRDEGQAQKAASNFTALARVAWSMPPDHGAALVRIILQSAELTKAWREELDEMRGRINGNRDALADAHPKLAFIKRERGLFSNLHMTKGQAGAIRAKHGIYLPDSGRINLAGMQPADAPNIVAALVAEGCL
jgi:aromatic-amino-acid transaminase